MTNLQNYFRRFFLCFLLCVWVIFTGYAKERQYVYRHYNSIVNNPTRLVTDIEQDKDGFIWICSDEGIFRFDGNEFVNIELLINRSACPEILKQGPIPLKTKLLSDNSGILWLYSTKYLYAMNPKSGEVLSLLAKEFEGGMQLNSIVRDDLNQLWLGTSTGVFLMNATNHEFKQIEYIQDVTAISEPHNNTVACALRDGRIITFQSDGTKISLLTLPRQRRGTPLHIRWINDFELLIGYSTSGGLWKYNNRLETINVLIEDVTINSIEPGADKSLWIATKNGIYIYRDGDVSLLRQGAITPHTPSESFTSTLKCDREGGMWVGTYYKGFYYIPHQPIKFDFFVPNKTHSGLKGSVVMSFCEDKYNNIWVITQDDGINKYNPADGTFVNYSKNNPKNKLLSANFYSAIAIESELWVGSIDLGIEVLDIASGRSLRKYQADGRLGSINSDVIITFHRTQTGELFVGTSMGLMSYDREEDQFNAIHKGSIGGVSSILMDSKKRLWVGTWDGLFCITPDNRLTGFTARSDDPSALLNHSITSVFEDSKGVIYIGTYDGLERYNEDGTFTHFKVDVNTACAVNGMVEDKNQIIWGTSDNGLFMLPAERDEVIQFVNLDGSFEKRLNQMPYLSKKGEIYFGMHNGFVAFDYQPRETNFQPDLFITGVGYFDPKTGKDSLILWNKIDEHLKLGYRENSLTFHYAIPAYTYMDNFQCSYKLDGVDSDWRTFSGYVPLEFYNLKPGKYTLRMKVSDLSREWQDMEQVYTFTIAPPFWLTTLAILFYVVVLVWGTYFLIRYYARRQERNEKVFKDEVENQKEKELYNAKIHFFMMIAHEIRTPLSLIKLPVEHLLEKEQDAAIKKDLTIIEKNVTRLTDLCSQLLDFRKTEADELRLNFLQTNLNDFMEEMLCRFSPVMEGKSVLIEKEFPKSPLWVAVDREAFTKICSNLLNNAAKYSDRLIRIRMEADDKHAFISVMNDGYRISPDDKEKIFTMFYRTPDVVGKQGSGIGLSITKQLAEMHQGNVELLFDHEGMNHFRITIPVNQEIFFNEQVNAVDELTELEVHPNFDNDLKTILIVEDDRDLSSYLAEYFRTSYHVITAYDCTLALDVLKKNVVSLVVSDIVTPGNIDGLQLCKIIKSSINLSHIPVILVTSTANMDTKIMGIEYGADAYMEKPFSIKYLSARIKNLLKNREQIYETLNKKPVNPFASTGKNSAEQQFLDDFYRIIEKHMSDPELNMQFLATQLNISHSSVYKKIKDLTGISPNDFIRVSRLKRGAALILEGRLNIKEIAYTVGYSSPAYFSTSFLRQFGTSPSDYAKEHSVNLQG